MDCGGETQNRTGDTRIFSPLLYQLSYLATPGGIGVGPMRSDTRHEPFHNLRTGGTLVLLVGGAGIEPAASCL